MRLMLLALAAAALPFGAASSNAQTSKSDAPREVNITQGSDVDWIPSVALEERAKEAWAQYHDHIARGEYAAAYAMLSSGLQSDWPFEKFESDQVRAAQERGTQLSRERIKITWTKDGPTAPAPGVYVAIDANARYDRVDRHCGYTVLYQAPDSKEFLIARIEENLLDNASAETIASKNSPLQLELVWRVLASNCPNYMPPPLPDSIGDGIEFETAVEARLNIEAREEVEVSEENGWTLIFDQPNMTAWSFAPEGSPYHPTAIKRSISETPDGKVRLSMSMKCGVDKQICDRLYTEMAYRNGLIPVEIN